MAEAANARQAAQLKLTMDVLQQAREQQQMQLDAFQQVQQEQQNGDIRQRQASGHGQKRKGEQDVGILNPQQTSPSSEIGEQAHSREYTNIYSTASFQTLSLGDMSTPIPMPVMTPEKERFDFSQSQDYSAMLAGVKLMETQSPAIARYAANLMKSVTELNRTGFSGVE
jgi:hypothetical protein